MAKSDRNTAAVETAAPPATQEVATTAAAVETLPAGPNFTLAYRRDHPGNRCSYGIAGNPGIVVFDKNLFKDGVAPAEIGLTCEMVPVKSDNKTAKAEQAAAKLAERAAKAQAKIEATQAKVKAAQDKAAAAVAAAQAKVAAAQAAAAPAAPAKG